MNKLKRNARILLVLIISAFIIIPIVAVFVSKLFGVQENMEEYDMSGKNVKMDVAKMIRPADGETYFGYCLGGDIKCRDDRYTRVKVREYKDERTGKTHNIYKAKCECPDDDKEDDGQCPETPNALVKCDGRNVKKIIEDTGIPLTNKDYDNLTNLITLSDTPPNKF